MNQGNKKVFINCPYQKTYFNKILKPIVFSLVYGGLEPRVALMKDDGGQLRMEKILEMMKESEYSIHDLSLLKVKKGAYPRMNMPFEFGIDYGLKQSESGYDNKKFLILTKDSNSHKKALSDIGGLDGSFHSNNTQKAIECVCTWLVKNGHQYSPALSVYYEFIKFNGWLYLDYLNQYGADAANEGIQKMEIPDYINYIKKYLKVDN